MFNKFKKKPQSKPTGPRPLNEIQQQYAQLTSQVGQAQYQIYVYQQEVERINKELRSLNYEAAQRSSLDQAEAAKKQVSEENKKEESKAQ